MTLTTLVQATQSLSEQMARLSQQRQNTRPDVTFSGADEEDPVVFIDRMEEYFTGNQIPDAARLPTVKAALIGGARTWFETLNRTAITYEFFKNRFWNKFKSTTVISQTRMRLYGEKQKKSEEAWLFITRKGHLFKRLAPETDVGQQVAIISEQLLPELRLHTTTRK